MKRSVTHYNLKPLILAAGKGTRLKPLTDFAPKPILPFAGIPLLYINIWKLQKLGFEDIKINAHYKWKMILEAVNNSIFKNIASVAIEKEKLLGTGGVYPNLKAWRKNSDLLVINGDIIHNFDLLSFIDNHYSSGAVASMLLLPQPFPDKTIIWCKNGRVMQIGKTTCQTADAISHSFGCVQLLSDSFLNQLPSQGSFEIIDYYQKALENNQHIAAHSQNSFWYDFGTPEHYLQAQLDFLNFITKKENSLAFEEFIELAEKIKINLKIYKKGLFPQNIGKIQGPCLITKNLRLKKDASFGPYAIAFEDLELAEMARASYSIFMSEFCVEEKKEVKSSICSTGKTLTKIDNLVFDFV